MLIVFCIIEYILLGGISYIFLTELPIKFKKNDEYIDVNESTKRVLLIIMSIFWIIFIPRLYFNSKNGGN